MVRRPGIALAAVALCWCVGDGAEGPVIVSFLAVFIDPIAQHIIETKKHFDTIAEVICTKEINRRQTGQEWQD
jgi:hypothetical protein